MKTVYILLVLVVAAAALGCMGKKGTEPSTGAPVSQVPPAQTSAPPTSAQSNAVADSDMSGLDNDLTQLDSLFNESSMDISLSEVNANAFALT